jgi:hypothetical protein
MTKQKAAFRWRAVAGQGAFFITLGAPTARLTAHDHSGRDVAGEFLPPGRAYWAPAGVGIERIKATNAVISRVFMLVRGIPPFCIRTL